MASMNAGNKGRGAAEEPEPEPDDASSGRFGIYHLELHRKK